MGTALAASEPATSSVAVGQTSLEPAPAGEPITPTKLTWPPDPKPTVKPKPKPKPQRVTRSFHRATLTGSPQSIAHAMVLRRGWSEAQWGCLDRLWERESNWSTYAENSSGAYGIPQALPGSKMSMMGSDWRTNPVTQIRWGLWYIANTYGSPCNALAHSDSYNYY